MNRKAMLYLTGVVAAAATLPPAVKTFWGWQANWGATEDEVLRIMPGDQQLDDDARYVRTRAITVDAAPEDVYPWLAQMGKGRGGLYSWDFLDRLFGFLDAPSVREILPEWQGLQPGDEIPIGRGGNFPVVDLKANEFLHLGGEADGAHWTWVTGLYRTDDGMTRIVTRNTGFGGAFGNRFFMAGMDLAAFIMVHRWLNVLKQRAEGLHRKRMEVEAQPAEG